MTEDAGRTLVCSVLFVDIVAYSKRATTEQYDIKRRFNGLLSTSLEVLKRRDRIIVDTGDGAAVVFLGDPEDALVIGVAMRGHAAVMPMRMGINLGPVKLIDDLNGQVNVIGDGINVAQRVMSFAEPGQLLVSANYHDVVSRVSPDYLNLFVKAGRRQDKHVREYEVYAVSEELRIGADEGLASLTDDLPQDLKATGRYRRITEEQHAALPAEEPAKVLDAGSHLIVSGLSRASVNEAVTRLAAEGSRLIAPVAYGNNMWVASCTHPGASKEVKVEEFGLTRIVSGESRQAVADRVAEILAFGGKLRGEIELVDGLWTAVCDT